MNKSIKMVAAEFMVQNPGYSVIVGGGGTSVGMKTLMRGEADICIASRPIEPGEIKELVSKQGSLGISTIIAKDEIVVYVNSNNPINGLSLTELKQIFTGKSGEISESGRKFEYKLILRSPNSGTYSYFRKHILENEEYGKNSLIVNSPNEVIEQIVVNKNSIGLSGELINGNESIKPLLINGVSPGKREINSEYPLVRYIHFYTLDLPEGKIKKFLDFVNSESGQKIIEQNGFISLWGED
jgi:phosphate transport system substrate-binding protein